MSKLAPEIGTEAERVGGMAGRLPAMALSAALALFGAGAGSCTMPTDGDEIPDDPAGTETVTGEIVLARAIPGLSAEERDLFEEGKEEFQAEDDAEEGLGPIFNDVSCAACHKDGGIGGAGTRTVTRFGRVVNGIFDPLASKGGSLIQSQSIGAVSEDCPFVPFDAVPREATVVAQRVTTPLFGLGLVDATPDSTFAALAAAQRRNTPDTAGRMNIVRNPRGQTRMGKFGWKSQVSDLFTFSGDAYLNEMGITSPEFPNENCPNGDCALLERCNPAPDLNDDGEDVELFEAFMKFLAPPSRGRITEQVRAGEQVFSAIGCADCHTPTIRSGSHESPALTNKIYHPYSDFLLHDMGDLGDGIGAMGIARLTEMRTAPLWGLRARTALLHNGTARSIPEAIERHRGQGEKSRFKFSNLSNADKTNLVAFLRSL